MPMPRSGTERSRAASGPGKPYPIRSQNGTPRIFGNDETIGKPPALGQTGPSSSTLTVTRLDSPLLDSEPEDTREEPWKHPDELAYIHPTDWSQDRIIAFLADNGFSVPARPSHATEALVAVTSRCGMKTMIPRGYRVPLMFVAKFQWESLRLVMTSLARDREWEEYKFDILHVARLCKTFLESARKAASSAPMDKTWRCPTFDRALTRYYQRWLVNREEFVKDFWIEFEEEEYEKDVLKNDWSRFVLKGHKGFSLTKEEVKNGVKFEELTYDLDLPGGRSSRDTLSNQKSPLPPAPVEFVPQTTSVECPSSATRAPCVPSVIIPVSVIDRLTPPPDDIETAPQPTPLTADLGSSATSASVTPACTDVITPEPIPEQQNLTPPPVLLAPSPIDISSPNASPLPDALSIQLKREQILDSPTLLDFDIPAVGTRDKSASELNITVIEPPSALATGAAVEVAVFPPTVHEIGDREEDTYSGHSGGDNDDDVLPTISELFEPYLTKEDADDDVEMAEVVPANQCQALGPPRVEEPSLPTLSGPRESFPAQEQPAHATQNWETAPMLVEDGNEAAPRSPTPQAIESAQPALPLPPSSPTPPLPSPPPHRASTTTTMIDVEMGDDQAPESANVVINEEFPRSPPLSPPPPEPPSVPASVLSFVLPPVPPPTLAHASPVPAPTLPAPASPASVSPVLSPTLTPTSSAPANVPASEFLPHALLVSIPSPAPESNSDAGLAITAVPQSAQVETPVVSVPEPERPVEQVSSLNNGWDARVNAALERTRQGKPARQPSMEAASKQQREASEGEAAGVLDLSTVVGMGKGKGKGKGKEKQGEQGLANGEGETTSRGKIYRPSWLLAKEKSKSKKPSSSSISKKHEGENGETKLVMRSSGTQSSQTSSPDDDQFMLSAAAWSTGSNSAEDVGECMTRIVKPPPLPSPVPLRPQSIHLDGLTRSMPFYHRAPDNRSSTSFPSVSAAGTPVVRYKRTADHLDDGEHDEGHGQSPVVKKIVSVFRDTLEGLTDILATVSREAEGSNSPAPTTSSSRGMPPPPRSSPLPGPSTSHASRPESAMLIGELLGEIKSLRESIQEDAQRRVARDLEMRRLYTEMDHLRRQVLRMEQERTNSGATGGASTSDDPQVQTPSPEPDGTPSTVATPLRRRSTSLAQSSSHPLSHLLEMDVDDNDNGNDEDDDENEEDTGGGASGASLLSPSVGYPVMVDWEGEWKHAPFLCPRPRPPPSLPVQDLIRPPASSTSTSPSALASPESICTDNTTTRRVTIPLPIKSQRKQKMVLLAHELAAAKKASN